MIIRRNLNVVKALCTVVALGGLVFGPFAPTVSAATKSKGTVPPKKTVAKKAPKAPVTTRPSGKKPNAKLVADTSAGRDKFCDALVVFKQQIADNLYQPAPDGATAEEIVNLGAARNALAAEALAPKAHLPILKWAAIDAVETYIGVIGSVNNKENPQEQLDTAVKTLIADGLEGITLLNAYAHTRCNLSLFLYSEDNIDGGPDDEVTQQLAEAVAQDAVTDSKAFPPKPPAGKKWPRASLFS
jgi:hypothetical protein